MKKFFKFLLIAVPLLVVVALVALYFSLNILIKTSVENLLPQVTQTDVQLDKARVSPFSGKGELQGLVIGNPAGFKTDAAFRLGQIRLVLDPRSLRTDTIVIDEIIIDAPEITYEKSLKSNNIRELQKNIETFVAAHAGAESPETPADEESAGPGKKVVINRVLISNARIRVSATLLQGTGMNLTMPDIELHDLGKGDSDGMTGAEAISEIYGAITENVLGVVGSIKDLGKTAIDTATGSVKGVTDTATGAVDGIKGLGRGLLGRDKDSD